MKKNAFEIDYEKWGQVVVRVQLIIALCVFLVEVVNNIILYVTRSQGYGPDTILGKLFRYLFLTSLINFGMVALSKWVDSKEEDENKKRYLLMTFTTLICTDVAFSHYQFAVTLAIFVVPLVICMLYEDRILLRFTLIISIVGQIIAVIARGVDAEYNKDIGPEAAIGISTIVCVFIFCRIIIRTLETRRSELKDAVIAVEKANASSEKIKYSLKMLETLAGTLDAKDKYTNGHSLRVSAYSTKLANALGWDAERVEILRYEALLHDIGKIGVPDAILNKPSRLSDMEFSLIKSHTVVGSDILKNMIAVPSATDVARHHHERYDGKGYPDALSGEGISINARIVCIADSYDAMSSDRIYRKALSPEIIRQELVKGRGTQFDPVLLDKFIELFDNNQLYSPETLTISSDSKEQQEALNEIKELLYKFNDSLLNNKSMYDFDKFYKYMRNIGLRYNRTVEVLQIDVERIPDADLVLDENIASDIVQVAIRKNIRAVDVYYKHSAVRHMVILLDAGKDNIDIVKKRILFDYNTNALSKCFDLKFTLNDYYEAPNQNWEAQRSGLRQS